MSRRYIKKSTDQQIKKTAEIMQKKDGVIVSPHGTGIVVEENAHKGHITGLEERWLKEYVDKRGFTKEQHSEIENNPNIYHIEPPAENLSHKYEEHDHDQGMMNVASYMAGEYPEESSNIFYCYHEDGTGEVLVKNQNTGELSLIANFGYDYSQENIKERSIESSPTKELVNEEMYAQEEEFAEEEQYEISM